MMSAHVHERYFFVVVAREQSFSNLKVVFLLYNLHIFYLEEEDTVEDQAS